MHLDKATKKIAAAFNCHDVEPLEIDVFARKYVAFR